MSKKLIKLRQFNNALTIVVVLLGLYILFAPLAPQLTFWWRKAQGQTGIPYNGNLAKENNDNSSKPEPPKDNRLVIPVIGLNEPIEESRSISTLNDGGTWHRPGTPTPPENGNSVIVGHRFFYSAPATFFHLDKVKVGDQMAVYWQGKELIYKVTDKQVVPPDAGYIEGPTKDRRLTIYTCTPLWTSKSRLVLTAKPTEEQP